MISRQSALRRLPIMLPPGWASSTAAVSQRFLSLRILLAAGSPRTRVCVVLTSPAYVVLARVLKGKACLIYYCADDYRSYVNWGGSRVAELESELVQICEHSFFVSDALRERAISEYGLRPERTSTSMNATETRFLDEDWENSPISTTGGATVGVIGWVNERIDISLLEKICTLEEVRSLILVGPIAPSVQAEADKLRKNPKCRIQGLVAHDQLHNWTRQFDIAVIPFSTVPLNHYCSPMRLFDHMASGVPIIATPACDQIKRFDDAVTIASGDAFVEAVRQKALGAQRVRANVEKVAQDHLWDHRAGAIASVIELRT